MTARRLLLALALLFPPLAPVAAQAAPLLDFGGPFALVDQDGRPRTDKDFLGHYLLVYFGYTRCPILCPSNLAEMTAALDELGALAARVRPIFITVDPARDKPEALKQFIANFHPRLIGLGGTERQVAAAARAYGVLRAKLVAKGADRDDYLVNHSPNFFLMGPDGKFLALIPHATDAPAIARILRKYLS